MNNKRYSIYEIELGDSFFPADQNLIDQYTLIIGKNVDDDIEGILVDSLRNLFSRRALEYHYIRLHTEWEMKQYVKKVWYESYKEYYSSDLRKNYNLERHLEEVKEEVVQNMVESELLDDREFAAQFVDSRRRNKPRGKFLLVKELMQKGVDKDLAKKVVDDIINDESVLVKKLLKKKKGREMLTYDDQKIINYLKRKGFAWSAIKSVIEENPNN